MDVQPEPQHGEDKMHCNGAATEHMQALEKSPERVKKFFHDARVQYAA